jgi:hypothetical protein
MLRIERAEFLSAGGRAADVDASYGALFEDCGTTLDGCVVGGMTDQNTWDVRKA